MNAHDVATGSSHAAGVRAEGEAEPSELWPSSYEAPSRLRHTSTAPSSLLLGAPYTNRDHPTPRSAYSETMGAPFSVTPPRTPHMRDQVPSLDTSPAVLMQSPEHAGLAYSPYGLPSPAHTPMPAWNEAMALHHSASMQAMSTLGYPASMQAHPYGALPFGMHSFASSFIAQGTTGDTPHSLPTGMEGAYAQSLTPAMAATSLQSPTALSSTPASPVKLLSPTRRGRMGMPKLPRKAQSTPLFDVSTPLDMRGHPSTSAGARGPQKTLRKYASNKRINGGAPFLATASTSDTKGAGQARLRGRPSMMVLHEANGGPSTSRGPGAKPPNLAHRRPVTLNFINYGINDAEALCAAVAPSGSYRALAQQAAQSTDMHDGDGAPEDEKRYARATPQSHPCTPKLRPLLPGKEGASGPDTSSGR